MPTVTRAALIQAIEAGIAVARTLTVPEKIALRLVAITATEVSVGLFDVGAGCPLTQAGQGVDAGYDYNDQRHERFYGAFDRVMDSVLDGALDGAGNSFVDKLAVVE